MSSDDVDTITAALASMDDPESEPPRTRTPPAAPTAEDSAPTTATPEMTPAKDALPHSRSVAKVVPAFETAEGVGSRVKRTVGNPSLWNLSPFLILDYARVKPGEGFPDHPHRGMATVTYVLEGMMQREDFMGNRGRLSTGDVQWMTAGRGIVHSEMPYFDPDDLSPPDAVALQLWIDLPAGKKMVKPSYKERKAESLTHVAFDGGRVTIVSGESHGAVGPIHPLGGCWFLDYHQDAGGDTWQEIPEGWTAFLYVLEGGVVAGEAVTEGVRPHHACVLSAAAGENGIRLRAAGKKGTRFVVIAGEPLNQPMILQGPFVSTSKDGAVQALRDFQSGRNGFEKALGWQSEIGKEIGTFGTRRKKPAGKKGAGAAKGGGEGWEERDPNEGKRGGGRKKNVDEAQPEPEIKGKGKGKKRRD